MQVDKIVRSAGKDRRPNSVKAVGQRESPSLLHINSTVTLTSSHQRMLRMALLFIKRSASSSIKQQELCEESSGSPHSEKGKIKRPPF